MSDKVEQLISLLGFDPSKNPITSEVLKSAISDLNEERIAAQKIEAKKLIAEAIDLQGQRKKLDQQYKEASEKVDKTLGRLIDKINSISRVVVPATPVEEK